MNIKSININEFFKALSDNNREKFDKLVKNTIYGEMHECTKKSLAIYVADRDGVDYETAYDVIRELQWQFNELTEKYNGNIPIPVIKQLLEDWLHIKISSDDQAKDMAKPFL